MSTTFFEISCNDKKAFLLSSIVFLISCFFIFLSGFLYIDDNVRMVTGEIDLASQGRPFAHIILSLFKVNGYVVDVRPLPQLLLTILVGVSAVLILRIYPFLSSFEASCLSLLIYMSPFYLQNISYSFDCITMGVSVFFAILVVYCLDLILGMKRVIVLSLIILGILASYQPALNVALALLYAKLIINTSGERKEKAKFFSFFLSMAIAFILYKCSMPLWFHPTSYSAEGAKLLQGDFLDTILHSIKRFYKFIAKGSDNYLKIAFFTSIILSVASVFLQENKNIVIKMIYAIFVPVIILMLVPGIMLVLKYPLVEARTMIGFGAVLASFQIICLASSHKIIKKIILCVMSVAVFGNMLVALSYGNVLMNVTKENYYNAGLISEKAFEISERTGIKKISLVGTIADSGYVEKMKGRVHIIDDLLLSQLGEVRGGNFFSPFMMYLNTKKSNLEFTWERLNDTNSIESVYKGSFYEIKVSEDTIFIVLNK